MTPALDEVAADLDRVGRLAGLDAVGVTHAGPLVDARAAIDARRDRDLHGGMQFTYRNPARSTEPDRALAGARAIVVGARSYRRPPGSLVVPTRAGQVARYSWTDAYADLHLGLEAMAEILREAGWRTRVLADDNAMVDREAAFRAGIGWYGKNTMLLLHGRGSEFVLGSVLTDAPLAAAAAPEERSQCGPCARCLPACPTGALIEPGVLDARRCLAWLLQAEGVFPREFRIALAGRIYGCDTCQDVCPPNRLEIRRTPPATNTRREDPMSEVDLVALLGEPDDDALLSKFGRWYIARRQARYLRRNALVALGNVGDGRDPATADALARHLASDTDDLVRAHAVWAAARLDRLDLVDDGVAPETAGPLVEAELGALPVPR